MLTDQPPSLRYQEFSIPLPKSNELWAASDEDERRRFQWNEPAGREKALLSLIMRDVLKSHGQRQFFFRLSEADHHLGLCAMQGGIWEASHEAYSCELDELVASPTPEDLIHQWRANTERWRTTMEDDRRLRQNYFFGSESSIDRIFGPLNLLLYHLSALTLHAPLKLLQGHSCCFKCRPESAAPTQRHQARIRAWIATSCPRTAVWNAGQICRVVSREMTLNESKIHLKLNPLAVHCVLKSAIVTCSFAHLTRACSACTGGSLVEPVDLIEAADEDVKVEAWKEQGEGLATWGPFGIPVCECKLMELAAWFRRILATNKTAENVFMAFIGGLGK